VQSQVGQVKCRNHDLAMLLVHLYLVTSSCFVKRVHPEATYGEIVRTQSRLEHLPTALVCRLMISY
jgi:hypothetical protein